TPGVAVLISWVSEAMSVFFMVPTIRHHCGEVQMKRFSGLLLRIVFFGCRLIGFSRLTLLMPAGKVSVSEPLSNLYNQAPKDANENPLLRGKIIKESFECVQLLAPVMHL
ncbi:hypothetical protein, partial [Cronobacter sakazakii]|uniref:hypothetical protein n=1 Tax=Cronobacter sakazakii TaxID=28141 RepID=UPI001F60FEF7